MSNEKIKVRVLRAIHCAGKNYYRGQVFLATPDFISAAGAEYLEPVVEIPEAAAEAAPETAPEKPVSRMNKAELSSLALGLGYEKEVVEAASNKELKALIEEAEKDDSEDDPNDSDDTASDDADDSSEDDPEAAE